MFIDEETEMQRGSDVSEDKPRLLGLLPPHASLLLSKSSPVRRDMGQGQPVGTRPAGRWRQQAACEVTTALGTGSREDGGRAVFSPSLLLPHMLPGFPFLRCSSFFPVLGDMPGKRHIGKLHDRHSCCRGGFGAALYRLGEERAAPFPAVY